MRLGLRATLDTLGAIVVVFVLQFALGFVGWQHLFVLAPPLSDRPWTVVTSIYAHAGLGHLLANGLALAIVGPLVARRTSRLAFHGFFVVTGAIAGVSQIVLGGLLGPAAGVLGASGAIFALLGYLLSGNVVSMHLLDHISLSTRAQFLLFLAIAVLITLATAGTRTALFGHATGLICGLVAGRERVLG